MRIVKLGSVLVVLGALAVAAFMAAPSVSGQSPDRRGRELTVLAGRGSEIGVSIRDIESSDRAAGRGVVVEDVRPNGPAEKAGLKRSDVIVEFDGEHVRSARQFARLVQETVPGKAVKATVLRDSQKKDIEITPDDRRDGMTLLSNGAMRDYFGNLDRPGDPLHNLPNFNFDAFPFAQLFDARGRLGITIDELTPQLATYFGVKDGVLVTAVTEDSPAGRAGLKAGDVITKIGNDPVRSRDDVLRAVREARDDVTLGIVRDKKESAVTVKLEPRRPLRRGQPA